MPRTRSEATYALAATKPFARESYNASPANTQKSTPHIVVVHYWKKKSNDAEQIDYVFIAVD